MDVFQMLASDHRSAERLFERLGTGTDAHDKRTLFKQLQRELDAHAQIEEEIFYPALRHDGADTLLDDSLAEHAAMKRTMTQMDSLDVDSEAWRSQLDELSRSVSHHVHEEENRLFPRAQEVLSTRLQESLAERIQARKIQLQGDNGGAAGERVHEARERASETADRAREWASGAASEVAHQAQARGREFLEQQTRSAAGGTREVADALRGTGEDLDRRGQPELSEYVMRAADGLNQLSERLSRGDVDGMLRQVTETARRYPGALFGGAIAAGFLVSRFLKSTDSRNHEYQPGASASAAPAERPASREHH